MIWDVDAITKITAERKNNSLLKRSRSQDFKEDAKLNIPLTSMNQANNNYQQHLTKGSDILQAEDGENPALENTPSSFRFKLQKMNVNGKF